MSSVRVADNYRYLVNPRGESFFIIGANYEGYFDRAWKMWDDNKFDPALINQDFTKMANTGLTVVRLFVLPALEQDVKRDNFSKLDKVIQLAADHHLLVLLTFNDAHSLNLAEAAAVDARIAGRYQDDPVILGWDLENEPVFYNFAAAIYPAANPAPIHTSALIDQYGVRVSQQEALELQRQRRIPAHLTPLQAYYYINALRIFIEFNTDATTWVANKGLTLVEYIYSNDSAKWHKLIQVLNGTVEAWLAVRHTPVRAADPNHLITVGYNWLHFAALPANRLLDFQEYHKYGSASLSQLNEITRDLTGLKKVFPKHPLIMGEFGYSNQTGTNPVTSHAIEGEVTALFELALLAYLRANEIGGGLKWMLNDVDTTANPYEAGFGIYRVGDFAKPIRDLLANAAQTWDVPPAGGTLQLVQDRVGLAFKFTLGNKIIFGGGVFQDESFSWQADEIAYCTVELASETMHITAQGTGHFAVDPWEVIPNWQANRRALLYRVNGDTLTQLATFAPGDRAVWDAQPGTPYRLMMAAPAPEPPPENPAIVPNPGEHVVLLGTVATLDPALPYIRHFTPDVTFAPAAAVGKWAYVTIVATPDQVTEAQLTAIKNAGAQIVERITGDITAVLNTLIAQNRRFLATLVDPDPGDDPVDPLPAGKTYIVQPGDTLSKIALAFYGKAGLWTIIFEANRDVLDSPSRIRPGMTLKIPPKPES